MAKALAIVGFSGSGKTELICRLVDWLARRGLQVAVLKHTHHEVSPGDEGHDTWRFRQAGARLAALAAPGLLQISREFPGEPSLSEALAALAPQVDLVLVEGYKSSSLPKILVINPPQQESPPNLSQVIATVSPAPVTPAGPVFRPSEVAALGAFILDYLGLNGSEK